ncbi:hypothetical protein [Sphingomonas sp. TDK1]|uniref:hypothetical protein n=1 Tax=Sphingomonas sp. TDK1 TaxID=453247 RepID=UPI0007D9DF2B|nr:hypothetical protein [Sphingomonas sp. TDK1]OAN57238.1 hypothetical protein A7X12_08470 [Sphingomonas sp. TDK1]
MAFARVSNPSLLILPLLLAGCTSNNESYVPENSMKSASAAENSGEAAAPPQPRVPCAVTGTRETAADCAEFARNITSVKAGVDAFQPEQVMVRDQQTTVRYSVSALPDAIQGENGEIATASDSSTNNAEIAREVAETANMVAGQIVPDREAGQVETHVVKLGQRMFACLSGDPSFTIGPAQCQVFNLVETPNPVWIWQVTPTKAGPSFKLYLRSGIALEGSDGSIRRIGRYSTTREIKVTVSAIGRFQDFLGTITAWVQSPTGAIAAVTALLGAIAALVAAYRKLRPATPPKAP